MAGKQYQILDEFQGVNTAVSERDNIRFSPLTKNFDTNIEKGKLTSRAGSAAIVDTAAADVDKFVAYRDVEWDKDVLLVYEKNATVANRQITLYHKTAGAAGNYAKQSSYQYSDGSTLEFGDDVNFIIHRNGIRIGTGTATDNKALYAGYIDRSVGGRHDAMFNDAIAFNDFFLAKQQWVQAGDHFSYLRKIRWDATRERFYCLTQRGVEIRDSDFRIERLLDHVRAYESHSLGQLHGGLEIIGNNLYAMGLCPDLDSSSDFVFKIVYYQLDSGYEKGSTEVEMTSTSVAADVAMLGLATDGTDIFLTWTDGTDSFMDRYSSTLATTASKAFTNAGNPDAFDCTALGTYVYIINDDTKVVTQVHKTAYTSATWATGKTGALNSIENDTVELILLEYDSPDSKAYNVTINGTFASSSISGTQTYTAQQMYNHSVTNSIVPYLFRHDTHQLLHFNDTTSWALTYMFPGKIALASPTSFTVPSALLDAATHFYGVSVLDIDNQEHHLMSGMAISVNEPINDPDGSNNLGVYKLKIVVSAQSELYDGDLSSPSSDETVQNSIWSEFRRIKKLRIYRAFADGWGRAEPTSSYRFIEDVDINDIRWSEDNANFEYSIEIPISIENSELPTTSYEESSDLPERFKPYYTNWKHASEQGGFYYYGNMRTDELNVHQFLATPRYSPDVAYQLDTNIDSFGVGDGDEVEGLAATWSRLIVFKGQRSAVYRGLNREATYDIGLTAPDSLLTHNNLVYFVYDTSIYVLSPSGYKKISRPIDTLLSAETMTGVSSVVFKKKEKLWFQVSGSDTYLYNYEDGTWDIYDINTAGLNNLYVTEGTDGEILTISDGDDKVYLQNTGLDDAGNGVIIYWRSNDLILGREVADSEFHRLFWTYLNDTDSMAVTLFVLNRNGWDSNLYTFGANSTGITQNQFLSGQWGQAAYFVVNRAITAALTIDSIGLEFSNVEAMINA